MKEYKTTDTPPQTKPQNQTKSKRGRYRNFSSFEEFIRVNSEWWKAEKRRRTQFMKVLVEEGRFVQREMIELFANKNV